MNKTHTFVICNAKTATYIRLKLAVDGTASTDDVICRLFGTTITTVALGLSPVQHAEARHEFVSMAMGNTKNVARKK